MQTGMPASAACSQAGNQRGSSNQVSIILDHLARPQLVDGPPYAADAPSAGAGALPQRLPELTQFNVSPATWGKATPQTFFGIVIAAYRRRPHRPKSWKLPRHPTAHVPCLGKAQAALAFASADERDWILRKTAQRLYPSLTD